MGIKERLQRIAWAIGGLFCEIGDAELDRRRVVLAEEVRRLHQYQEDYRRSLSRQEETLAMVHAHQVICDQERAEMKERLAAMNEDREALFRLLTKDQPEPPALQLVSGE